MSWLDKFVSAFAAEQDPYLYRDQKDVYRDTQQGTTGINQEKANPTSGQGSSDSNDTHKETGRNEDTDENFSVEVKKYSLKPKNPKDDIEKKWLTQETIVTFTSLSDESRSICSDLSDLCNGRFSYMSNLPSSEIAKGLASHHKEIFGHIEASLASYSSAIDATHALRLATDVSFNNMIHRSDYERIRNKVETSQLKEFDNLIVSAGITTSPVKPLDDYYVNYIKDFMEYKTENIAGLRKRVRVILGSIGQEKKNQLLEKFNEDPILSNLFK